jgi:hypothetical protein
MHHSNNEVKTSRKLSTTAPKNQNLMGSALFDQYQVFSFREVGSHALGVLLLSSLPNFEVGGYTGQTSQKIWEGVQLKNGEGASLFAVGTIDRYLPGSLAQFGMIIARPDRRR